MAWASFLNPRSSLFIGGGIGFISIIFFAVYLTRDKVAAQVVTIVITEAPLGI